jgi:hypothetical protein
MAVRILPYDVDVALHQVAGSLGIEPDDLNKLIDFESRWDPQAKNPYSSARGLLQFIDSTAQSLGFKDSADLVTKNPTRVDQLLGPVLDYLARYKPFDNTQALYMSVFYPSARNWAPDREFPDTVQNVSPGIRTVQNYVDKVEGKPNWRGLAVVAAAAFLGIGIYLFFS